VLTGLGHQFIEQPSAGARTALERIAAFLAEHGRYGIPFYLLYRPGKAPHVFSELPTKDGLIATVRQAAGGRPIAQR
jgi:hypothetical protein